MKQIPMLLFFVPMTILLTFKAQATETQYKIIDAGVMRHNIHGTGVEIRILPNPMPEGGLKGIKQPTFANVCKFYAPKIIPLVKERMGTSDVKFVGVRMVSSQAGFGIYVLQIFAIEKNLCGKKLN